MKFFFVSPPLSPGDQTHFEAVSVWFIHFAIEFNKSKQYDYAFQLYKSPFKTVKVSQS